MTIAVGVIGLGGMGTAHCKTVASLENARVVALCDIRPERMDMAVETKINFDIGIGGTVDLSGARKYTDYRRLLRNREVQAVVIALPSFLHARAAIAAFKAGKHVFSEKPIALTSREAVREVRVAAEHGRFLMVGHVLRFWPEYVMLKEMIDSRCYGRTLGASFRRAGSTVQWGWDNWFNHEELSGGCAMDLHIHDVDTILWFFGVPTKVSARAASVPTAGSRYIVALYEVGDVPMVSAEAGWFCGPYPFDMSFTVLFESATVDYRMSAKPTLTVYKADGTTETPAVPEVNACVEEVKYFIDCVAAATPPARMKAQDSALAVAIVEAELKSARTGKPVAVKPLNL